MNANAKMSHKLLRVGLWSLIGVEVGLALAYLISIWYQQSVPAWLDWNGLRSLPSLLQAFCLFAIGILALLLLVFRRRIRCSVSWLLPLALALLCFYGGLDELTKIHLLWKQYNWKAIYVAILVAIPVMCWRDLVWLWRTHRPSVLWVLLGLSIFLLGGFGAEVIKQTLYEGISPDATVIVAGQKMGLLFFVEHIRITAEEFGELLGETIILFGVAQFVLKSLSSAAH